jgi:hypothetical protein
LPRKRQRWSATTFLRDHWALDELRNARSTAFAISIFGTIVRWLPAPNFDILL